MASIRKRGSNSYLIVVSRGYDYEGNRLKSVQKTVKPPKEYTRKQAEKWVKEQAILFEREVQHTPEPINRSITLAKYIEHWAADIGPKKLADSTYQRDLQDIRRILPTLGNYKLTDLRKEVIRDFSRGNAAQPAFGRQRESIREVSRRFTQHAGRHPIGGCGRGIHYSQSRMEMLQTERTKERAPGS
mgnify:CR=1 FL=1